MLIGHPLHVLHCVQMMCQLIFDDRSYDVYRPNYCFLMLQSAVSSKTSILTQKAIISNTSDIHGARNQFSALFLYTATVFLTLYVN